MPENIFSKKDKDNEKIILREGVKLNSSSSSSSSSSSPFAEFKKFGENFKKKVFGITLFKKTKKIEKPKNDIKSEVKSEIKNEVKNEAKKIFDNPKKDIIDKKVVETSDDKAVKKTEKIKVEPIKTKEGRTNLISNPKILEMDLISDQIEISFDWKKNLSILGVFVLVSLVLVGEVYLTLFLWQKNEIYSKTEKLKVESQSITQEIQTNKEKAAAALVFKNRLEVIEPILAKHIYWTNFFTYLQEKTLADVFYSGFSGGVDGNYALKAFVKDFRAIGVQLKAFLNGDKTNTAIITNERIDNSGKDVGVIFDLGLSIKSDLFNK